jgi:hypothetical protein
MTAISPPPTRSRWSRLVARANALAEAMDLSPADIMLERITRLEQRLAALEARQATREIRA